MKDLARLGLLQSALATAVPLWVTKVLAYSDHELAERQKLCSETVACRGDILMYGGGKKGATAEAFNRLAEGTAILAIIAKGGVNLFGMRFDADAKTGRISITKEPSDREKSG